MFIREVRLDGFLSFAPGSPSIPLQNLNVIIGPNGSGKSNLLEAFALLQATPNGFSNAIREGGGADQWLWKGRDIDSPRVATIEIVYDLPEHWKKPLRYRLQFASQRSRTEVVDEVVEEAQPKAGDKNTYFFYRFQDGHPAFNIKDKKRAVRRETLAFGESVLSQRKDPDQYPEVTATGESFNAIQSLRDWTFGRHGPARQVQRSDLPVDRLLPDASNLALLVSRIEHEGDRLSGALKKFIPRFERISTLPIGGGALELFFHEKGLAQPIPATRLSDGTIRFIAMLATLLAPSPPPLLCIEEPELGLHPDAVVQLADLLIDASSRMQIIVTTHSEVLISALSSQPESVLVCEHLGGTVLKRLESKELEGWLQKYGLGDVWRMGALGGNP